MSTNMSKAQELLFGTSGLGASNIKLYTGSDRDATPEEIAGELAHMLENLRDGNYEVVEIV
ncbi:hypothetical protein L2Y96_17905 [Luteibacter aegosomaticola]|uniref:hypothetical protein n=1 Tax=Luteibacter aegosomaticola TaxID=2911538 RepID=UPI001FF8650E|nr:hypothetical protein [Luteibacter aegosomaticola]UPG89253.1 hypothetical protein L2Y96_17905 [Luteibacter aegosomaticola]